MTEQSGPGDRRAAERLAAALIGLLFLVSLGSRAIRWDWLFDTADLLAGACVALAPTRSDRLPLACCFLFLDSALQAVAGLFWPSVLLPIYLLLTGLYGSALRRRLEMRGIAVGALPWRALFRRPAGGLTLATLVTLGCLSLPMLHFYRADTMMTAPIVVTVGNVTTMSSGHPINLGGEVTYRGVQVAFGRAAFLLLATILILHLLRLGALVRQEMALWLMRLAAVAVALWWLIAARGFRSLDNGVDLVFIAGCGWLLASLFVPTAGDDPKTESNARDP